MAFMNYEVWPEDRPYVPSMGEWKFNLGRVLSINAGIVASLNNYTDVQVASSRTYTDGQITAARAYVDGIAATTNSQLLNQRPSTVKIGTLGWLEQAIPGTETAMQQGGLLALSPVGTSGGIFGLRSSDSPNRGGFSFAVGAFCLNNNTAFVQTDFAGYFEARRFAGAGTTLGVEVGTLNFGSVVDPTPYTAGMIGSTLGLWASAGRSDVGPINNSTLAFGIVNNGARFQKGIVFGWDAIAGSTSGAQAIAMAYQHAITWSGTGDTLPNSFIRSDTNVASSTGLRGIIFTDDGLAFRTPDGLNVVAFSSGVATFSGRLHGVGAATFDSTVAAAGNILSAGTVACQGAAIAGAVSIGGSLSLSNAIPTYANDAAAAGGGLPISGAYFNSSASYALTMRRT